MLSTGNYRTVVTSLRGTIQTQHWADLNWVVKV